MSESLKILIGGGAVLGLFVTFVWLLVLVNNRLDARANAIANRDPDRAYKYAQRIVMRLGEGLLYSLKGVLVLFGLMVLPGLFMIVYESLWLALPFLFIFTFVIFLIDRWVSGILDALAG